MGLVTPARVAGVESGLQAWMLESGRDGSAAKSLHRFALRGDERAMHIVGREDAADLVNHVRLGPPRLSAREYAHAALSVRVPAGRPVWERVSVLPKRRLLGRADFGVRAESVDVPAEMDADTWARRVLSRFVDADVDAISTVEDSFLNGEPALRHIVRLTTPHPESGAAWSCWWTGVVAGRGVAVALESRSELPLKRVQPFRDIFVLADA